ncbi:MAG TPA: sulfite exporter TauE/SafE family protein [Vicinamibacteria bacterium]|nr:sulfite exporter TauE/SafE family protein [Vicinamibacteria bacterium]
MTDASPWSYVLLAAVGFVASVVNIVAAGGSFLTLPVLILLGAPSVDANGTNRLGVIAQNATGIWGFHGHGVLDWPWALKATVPAVAGATLGAWLALDVDDQAFRRLLAVLMVGVTLWTLIDPLEKIRAATVRSPFSPGVAASLFLTGVYGGFVQAGVGFLVVAVTTAAGVDLLRGTAIKVLVIGVLTLAAVLVFAWHGHVNWISGLALASGSLAGGAAGVRLAILKGSLWLRHVVTGAVVAFAVLLWIS